MRGVFIFMVVLLFFFVSGACGLLYQVVWTRKLVLLFGTTSYAVSTVLSIFFLGLGAGSLWGGRLADRRGNPLLLYGVFEIIVGAWAVLFILAVGYGEGVVVQLLQAFDFSRGVGILLRGLLAAALLFVPVFLMGATLPLLAKFVNTAAKVRGLRVGALYTLNTFGAVAGCFVTGFFLIQHFGYTQTTLIGAAANVLIGVLAIAMMRTRLADIPAQYPVTEDVEPDDTTDAEDEEYLVVSGGPDTWRISPRILSAILTKMIHETPPLHFQICRSNEEKPFWTARFSTYDSGIGVYPAVKWAWSDTPPRSFFADPNAELTPSRILKSRDDVDSALEEFKSKTGATSLVVTRTPDHKISWTQAGLTLLHLVKDGRPVALSRRIGMFEGSTNSLQARFRVSRRGQIILSSHRPPTEREIDATAALFDRARMNPIILQTEDDVKQALSEYRNVLGEDFWRVEYFQELPPVPEAPEPLPKYALIAVLCAFALCGFCALSLEVLWTRLLSIVFLGTTYAYTTMLTTLLAGIAVGSAVASSFVDRLHKPMFWLGAIIMLFGAGCVWSMSRIATMPEDVVTLQLTSGAWSDEVWGKFPLAFAALFVPTFFSGMLFPFVVRVVGRDAARLGSDVGRLYSANTFGGVLGALAGGFLILPLLGTHWGILALSAMLLLGGFVVMLMCPREPEAKVEASFKWRPIKIRRRSNPPIEHYLVVVTLALLIMRFVFTPNFPDDINTALNTGYVPATHRVIETREGVEGTVVVTAPEDQADGADRVLWINRVQATTSIEKGVKMNRFQGVLPLLFDRQPKDVLFMCFGSGITCGTLALSDFNRIDAVEISPDVLAVAHHFGEDNLGVIDKPSVHFHIDDGRNYLLTTRNRYDLITFEPMPLALAGVSTFYTRDYYELCRAHLTNTGLVSQWVPLHALNPEIVRSLTRTFISVFPEYCAWYVNADLFLIGSNAPLHIDYAGAKQRLDNPVLQAALQKVGLPDLDGLLANYLMGKAGLDAYAATGRIMTDDRPWAEFEAPKLVNERHVAEALTEILPHAGSPFDILLPESIAPEERAALERRHESRMQDLQGVKQYYGGMAFDREMYLPFAKALKIDPKNANAKFYLRQIINQQGPLLVRWEEWDALDAMLKAVTPHLRGEPVIKDLQRALHNHRNPPPG